jgi:hypothetical protein
MSTEVTTDMGVDLAPQGRTTPPTIKVTDFEAAALL